MDRLEISVQHQVEGSHIHNITGAIAIMHITMVILKQICAKAREILCRPM